MAVGLNAGGKALMLSGFTAGALYVSLHTGDAGTNGANEVAGGTYIRKSASWGSPAAGTVANTAAVVINVPANTTIKVAGYWSAATNGTFYGSRALDADQTFGTAGTYTIAIGNLTEAIA